MTKEYALRRGDGMRLMMTKSQIVDDLQDGMNDAVDLGAIPVLSADELDKLAEILMMPGRMVGVEPGREVPVTHDIGTLRLDGDQGNSGVGIPSSRLVGMMFHERAMGADTMELGHIDYSYKPVKPVISNEMQAMEVVQQNMIVPILYGAMPNMGLYYTPDGPYANPGDLMKNFMIEEAQKATEQSAEHLAKDMVWIMQKMMKAGADGANFDTIGAAGDGDFLASLNAVEKLRKQFPNMYIETGVAGEMILGMHGELKYDGQTLAGMWPHQQVKLLAKAGSNVYGPAINTNTSKSFPWNLGRAVTFVKAAVEASPIPVHVNMGMGVGGIPMLETPTIDAVSHASKAMVEVAGVDGI